MPLCRRLQIQRVTNPAPTRVSKLSTFFSGVLHGDRHISALPQKSDITEVVIDHACRPASSSTASPAAMAASTRRQRLTVCDDASRYMRPRRRTRAQAARIQAPMQLGRRSFKFLRPLREARLYIRRTHSDYTRFCGEEISSRWWCRSCTKAIGRRDI